ncbi:MAG: (2Fe-2S) ferredoxin domain-containing protein, partial [Rubrobacter sp.]|nr:(2Fe-2S) ferredoxin domain-containing protein [Rubrobacter sp.]
ELLERFRVEVEGLGLSPYLVLRNACTRRHEEGPVVFVFPDDVWYTRVTPEDVPGIVEEHLGNRRAQVKG